MYGGKGAFTARFPNRKLATCNAMQIFGATVSFETSRCVAGPLQVACTRSELKFVWHRVVRSGFVLMESPISRSSAWRFLFSESLSQPQPGCLMTGDRSSECSEAHQPGRFHWVQKSCWEIIRSKHDPTARVTLARLHVLTRSASG